VNGRRNGQIHDPRAGRLSREAERGHDDGVGRDDWVAWEYAPVRKLYSKLGLPERTSIEFFPGPHEINLKSTLVFLEQHLR
jgi:hypothetical protein